MSAPAPRWVDARTILVPATATLAQPVVVQTPEGTVTMGDVIGDGAFEITEDDSRFEQWAQWLEASGHRRPGAPRGAVA